MSNPTARFKLPDGAVVTLAPGDILGRLRSAAGRVADPRVSEAHALLSLRGGDLRLLALRGVLTVDGIPEDEIALIPGLIIDLVPGFSLEVVDVKLPRHVLALQIADQPPRELSATSYSVVVTPQPDLIPSYMPGAPAYVWSTSETWMIRVGDGHDELITPGRSWSVSGLPLSAVLVDVEQVASVPTEGGPGRRSLEITSKYSAVSVRIGKGIPFEITGLEGRLLAELIDVGGGPVSWEVIASEIWPSQSPIRKSWDRVLGRLRRKLEDHGVRRDLVRMDGCGNVELFLLPGDRVVNRN